MSSVQNETGGHLLKDFPSYEIASWIKFIAWIYWIEMTQPCHSIHHLFSPTLFFFYFLHLYCYFCLFCYLKCRMLHILIHTDKPKSTRWYIYFAQIFPPLFVELFTRELELQKPTLQHQMINVCKNMTHPWKL